MNMRDEAAPPADEPATGELRLPDDRILTYCMYGPEDGEPVLFQFGTPGTRFLSPERISAIEGIGGPGWNTSGVSACTSTLKDARWCPRRRGSEGLKMQPHQPDASRRSVSLRTLPSVRTRVRWHRTATLASCVAMMSVRPRSA